MREQACSRGRGESFPTWPGHGALFVESIRHGLRRPPEDSPRCLLTLSQPDARIRGPGGWFGSDRGRTEEASRVIQTLRLYYPQSLVREPVINQLIRGHDITVNIVEAKIGLDEAWLQVEVSGADAEIHRAIEWLKAQGIDVQPTPEGG